VLLLQRSNLADLVQKATAQSAAVLGNGRRGVPKALGGQISGRLRRVPGEVAVTIELTVRVVAQPAPGWLNRPRPP